MRSMQTLGYRDEGLFGDDVTDPIEVAVHETRELGNVDIPRWLMRSHADELTKDELAAVGRIVGRPVGYTEIGHPGQNRNATDEDIEIMKSALKRILGKRDFCKWLCRSPQSVVSAYIAPYPDAADRLDDSECSVYVIPADAMPMTRPNDPEGTLWAWSSTHNTEPIEVTGMKDALRYQRERMTARINALYGLQQSSSSDS